MLYYNGNEVVAIGKQHAHAEKLHYHRPSKYFS